MNWVSETKKIADLLVLCTLYVTGVKNMYYIYIFFDCGYGYDNIFAENFKVIAHNLSRNMGLFYYENMFFNIYM